MKKIDKNSIKPYRKVVNVRFSENTVIIDKDSFLGKEFQDGKSSFCFGFCSFDKLIIEYNKNFHCENNQFFVKFRKYNTH